MTDSMNVYWSFRSPYSNPATECLRALFESIGIPVGPHIVRPIALRDPDFFSRRDRHWIDRELKNSVYALAAGLLALELKRGDRVGFGSLNRAEITELSVL